MRHRALIQEKVKYELRKNNQWKDINYLELNFLLYANPPITYRVTQYYSCNVNRQSWYHDGILHRLDGPAIIFRDKEYEIIDSEWWLSNFQLACFEDYYDESNPSQSVFNFIKQFPEFIKQIQILVKHNKWINEEQLLLLNSMDLFS